MFISRRAEVIRVAPILLSARRGRAYFFLIVLARVFYLFDFLLGKLQ
jgi:hypothetical protein